MEAVSRFIVGEDNFTAQTPWGGWAAFFMSIGFFVFQILVTILLGLALVLSLHGLRVFDGSPTAADVSSFIDITIITLMLSYVLTFGLILFVAARRGGTIAQVLQFKRPVNLMVNAVFGVLALVVFFVLLSFVIDTFFPQDSQQSEVSMKQIFTLIKKSQFIWGGVAIIVIGAPFLEEAVFRGFLLTSLASTRLGFWGGAAVSSALWAAIHGYAASMAVGLFVFGLLLSLLVRRTGSIWVSIFLHALWNAVVTAGVFATLGT